MPSATISRGGSNGFISRLGNAFAGLVEGAAVSAGQGLNQVLPIWTAKQIDEQLVDQLYNPTFDSRYAPVNTQPLNTTGNPSGFQKTGLLFDNFRVDGTGVMLIAVAAIGMVLVFRAAR